MSYCDVLDSCSNLNGHLVVGRLHREFLLITHSLTRVQSDQHDFAESSVKLLWIYFQFVEAQSGYCLSLLSHNKWAKSVCLLWSCCLADEGIKIRDRSNCACFVALGHLK